MEGFKSSHTNNKVMTINDDAVKQMDADKAHDRQIDRQRYARRTDAQKDHDRRLSRERYARRTDAQKDRDRQIDRQRYARRTDAQKDRDRQIDRERYARAHPNVRRYRLQERSEFLTVAQHK